MNAMTEKNAYILGTDSAELHRLGLQHQIWASEARRGWEIAEFGPGQTLLDLGCGPGYCSRDLAYMVGDTGKVIGVDRSASFINFLRRDAQNHDLNIELHNCDFDDLNLPDESLDGIYDRWALAWVPNPEEILEKLNDALRQGGVMVMQEYYDWSIFQTEPFLPHINKGIKAAYQTFVDSDGDINIGRRLPGIMQDMGMEVISVRTMSKAGYEGDMTWQWPKTFLEIYIPKLHNRGYLTSNEADLALQDLDELEYIPGASMVCPLMYEVVAVKV